MILFYEGFGKKQSQSFFGGIILIWVFQENIPCIENVFKVIQSILPF